MRNIKEFCKLSVRDGLENFVVAFDVVFREDDLLPEGVDGPELVVFCKAGERCLEVPPGPLREAGSSLFQRLSSVLGWRGAHAVHLRGLRRAKIRLEEGGDLSGEQKSQLMLTQRQCDKKGGFVWRNV